MKPLGSIKNLLVEFVLKSILPCSDIKFTVPVILAKTLPFPAVPENDDIIFWLYRFPDIIAFPETSKACPDVLPIPALL